MPPFPLAKTEMARDSKKNGRGFRRFASRLSSLLSMSESQRRVAGILLFLVFVVGLIWFVRGSMRLYLFGGQLFGRDIEVASVASFNVKCGETITRKLLLEYLGFEEGRPFFDPSFGLTGDDLGAKCANVLQKAPTLASLEVSRLPSNVVSIVATERIPIARLPSPSVLSIDRSGVVFVNRGVESLPRLIGVPLRMLRPGARVDGGDTIASAALELIEYMSQLSRKWRKLSLVLTSVDISNPSYLKCVFNDGIYVELAWKGMGQGADAGGACLAAQINGLILTLQRPQSTGCRSFNLRHPGKCFAK